MATTKPKKTATPRAKAASKTKPAAKSVKTVKATPAVTETKKVEQKQNVVKRFFAKKCDKKENILTIFKCKRLYAALAGEVLGTMVIAMVLMTLGVYQPLYLLFIVLGVTVAVYALSGAHLNPIVTVGMMATRRISAIRGVLYIIAQVLGAWFGLLILNAFRLAGGEATALPAMAAVADGQFWMVTMIEFLGATIIGFFFARALQYKRSALTFATVVSAGLTIAFIVVIVVSSSYASLSDNFILNPALALMRQILPTTGESFGELVGQIALALLTYVIFPMIGGVIGFFVSDVTSMLNDENVEQ